MVDWEAPASEASVERLLIELAGVLLIVLGLALVIASGRAVSWVWAGIGVVVTGNGAGVATTSFGRWLNEQSKRVGKTGQFLAVVAVGIGIGVAFWLLPLPVGSGSSYLIGSMGAVAVIKLADFSMGFYTAPSEPDTVSGLGHLVVLPSLRVHVLL